MKLPIDFVIYDTEYTSWEGAMERNWSGPGEERELVQLGAIKVNKFTEIDSLLLYIKPRINPELSQFFIDLTGVTQNDIAERGILFEEAYKTFMNWVTDLPMYSFGLDHEVIARNHEIYKTEEQIPRERFNDIREYFKGMGIDTGAYMSSTIPKAFNLVPPPQGHDALNDARSILMALRAAHKKL